MPLPNQPDCTADGTDDCGSGVTRRRFLGTTGAAAATVLLGDLFPGRVAAQDAGKEVPYTPLPEKRLGRLSQLEQDRPVWFNYPDGRRHNGCVLVKLGEKAGGGLGPDADVVAFSTVCTHMGGSLKNAYHAESKVCGPCPLHLTTFDLTRHGMVVAGNATEALPQVVLETRGDEIVAVGIIGLVYGYADMATE